MTFINDKDVALKSPQNTFIENFTQCCYINKCLKLGVTWF